MAIFKCKMCGGSLDISDGVSVATCEYCGTKQTVPKSKDEVVANLFNRANNLRLKCEFDKAEQVYEKILDIDNSDSEAHWGVVLCKYGIEYVEDTKTYSRIPTCHRTLYEAVLADINYLSAIENADEEQKELYIAEAKVIDELQKNILSIVNSEEPFDVFICYKETDEDGKRTIDSAITNDIYYQLTEEGFKVFYAPITLEDKLGHEYEPYIFAALNSAKVMLVVGTKPEYFDSVWVRNEWSRFFKSMKNDRSKLLIPCYRDMDVYELPDEFAHLQAQNMGKIGFITDVIRGLKKVFNLDEQVQSVDIKKKPKKPSKIKKWIERRKIRKAENAKYHLRFPLHAATVCFFVFTLILSIYLAIRFTYLYGEQEALPYILTLLLNFFLLPFIISGKTKNKVVPIILQSLVVLWSLVCVWSGFINVYYIHAMSTSIISAIINVVWLVLICCSKKAEKNSTKNKKPLKLVLTYVATPIISVVVVLSLEFFALQFCDYQLAKTFYYLKSYEYAAEYFCSLDDYKDSEVLATNAKLLELKNANIMEEVNLGRYWHEASYIDGVDENAIGWYVIAKEDTKVLLVNSSGVKSGVNYTIIGGWKNSTLRKFLNEEYYNSIFNEEIKSRIIPTELKNSSNANDITTDKIFILSKEELKEYFPLANDRAALCSWDDNNIILRSYDSKKYAMMQSDGSFTDFDYPYNYIPQKDANGDGHFTLSEALKFEEQYADYTDVIEKLNDAQYKAALWIDISNIK